VPVLSVPKEAKYDGIKEILFTTLFREKDEAALRQIMDIADKFRVKVKCAHVLKDKNIDIIAATDRWQKMFPQDNLEFVLLDMDQSIEHTLNKYIESNRVDLLCVVKRNKSLLERLFKSSMSNRLRMHANTATLVLHAGDDPVVISSPASLFSRSASTICTCSSRLKSELSRATASSACLNGLPSRVLSI